MTTHAAIVADYYDGLENKNSPYQWINNVKVFRDKKLDCKMMLNRHENSPCLPHGGPQITEKQLYWPEL